MLEAELVAGRSMLDLDETKRPVKTNPALERMHVVVIRWFLDAMGSGELLLLSVALGERKKEAVAERLNSKLWKGYSRSF